MRSIHTDKKGGGFYSTYYYDLYFTSILLYCTNCTSRQHVNNSSRQPSRHGEVGGGGQLWICGSTQFKCVRLNTVLNFPFPLTHSSKYCPLFCPLFFCGAPPKSRSLASRWRESLIARGFLSRRGRDSTVAKYPKLCHTWSQNQVEAVAKSPHTKY